MSNDLISVIIPVYNDDKYIKKCLKSVIRQTYRNIEIIVIDDGSTDNSFNICKEMQKIDNRIVIKRQKNKGCGDARNTGLMLAKGKYIVFVDSDDFIKCNMVKYDLDLLMF